MPETAVPVLAGTRVIDIGRYIAGPYCAALLASLGADVIRVEPIGGGADRRIAPLSPGGDGALFVQSNQGKRSLTLELAAPDGRRILRELVETADVVVANLPPRALAALGLDYAHLCAVRSDIILTAITAFGTEGPDRDAVGFDGVGQAMAGAMHLTGTAGQPMKAATPYVDFGTALAAAFGTLAALQARAKTGRGQQVDASLLTTALTFSGAMLTEEAVLQKGRVGTGNRGQLYGPADTLATRDGFVLVQVLGDEMFARWARLVDAPDLIDDPRMASDASRGDHRDVLSERLARWCAGRTSDEALRDLRAARIPCSAVLTPRRALEDAQVRATRHLASVRHPGIDGEIPIAQPPVRLGEGAAVARPAPAVGAHTDEILLSLGYDTAAIAALRTRGVV